MIRKKAALAFLTLTCVALPARTFAQAAASVPTRTLTRPEVEFSEPFSGLTGIRELRDGRVIIADRTEKLIALLDFRSGSMKKIGSVGQGPGEFQMLAGVIALPGDTTLVNDMLGRKYLRIAPNGNLLSDVPLPTAGGTGGMVSIGRGASNFDDMGRLYALGSPIRVDANGGMEPLDSAPITRWDIRSGKTDTVMYLRVPAPQVQSSGGGTNVMVRMGGGVPFTTQAAWTVAPDGRIAIVTPEPYQVTWVSPTGQRSAGAPIAYQRIRVNDAEKQAYREAIRSAPPPTMRVRTDGGATSVSTAAMPFEEPSSWPEFKHPFSSAGVMAAPGGELWILTQRAHTDRNPTFDIIGARGELVGRVAIPERSRLLGFGQNGAVYVVRRDADDLEYVGRYRLQTGM